MNMLKNKDAQAKIKKENLDYHDGANTTHYLSNEDYPAADLPDPNDILDNPLLDGKIANGNDLTDESLD